MTQHHLPARTPHLPRTGRPEVQPSAPQTDPGAKVFGSLFAEVTLNDLLRPALPALDGWSLRLWPQARLGDATLEARPEAGHPVTELTEVLRRSGITVLGPARTRRPA